MSITLFTVPKPFLGHTKIIQENAIQSWLESLSGSEIILFGDDLGVKEAAKKFNLLHVSKIKKNKYGTPLVSDVFQKARAIAKYDILTYVNADIILMTDFLGAIKKIPFERFLMGGQRWNLDIKEKINFDNPNWTEILKEKVKKEGKLEGPSGIDYFVFEKGTFTEVPPFAIGRTAWDNWLLWQAFKENIPIIDATEMITVIHQNHLYLFGKSKKEIWKSKEAKENLKLAGGECHMLTLRDADYKLTPEGIKKICFSPYRIFPFSLKHFEKSNIFAKIFLFPFWFAIYFKRKIFKFI